MSSDTNQIVSISLALGGSPLACVILFEKNLVDGFPLHFALLSPLSLNLREV